MGLSEEYLERFTSPFVKESYLKIGLGLKEIIHLSVNSTEMVIGEVECVSIDSKYVKSDGRIDISEMEPSASPVWIVIIQVQPGFKTWLAKPDKSPTKL